MSKVRTLPLVSILAALIAVLAGCATLETTDRGGNVSASPDTSPGTPAHDLQAP